MLSRKFNVFLLVVNVGLLAGTGYYWFTHRPVAEVTPTAEEPPATNEPVVIRTVEHDVVTNDFRWAQIESEDYRTYIARLRSIGCPEQTIRDLIIADLDKTLAPRMQSIVPRRKDLKFWQPEDEELWNNYDHREWFKQERSIDQEKREAVRELV